MSIQISRETESRLMDEARRRGISVEALIQQLIDERATPTHAVRNRSTVQLPVWHLGDAGSLHRRDIYDDVG
jgi:hypothetical protein